MKYYRYAKCMQGGKHPHLDLLIGESGRVPMKKAEVSGGRKLRRDWGKNMQVQYRIWLS